MAIRPIIAFGQGIGHDRLETTVACTTDVSQRKVYRLFPATHHRTSLSHIS